MSRYDATWDAERVNALRRGFEAGLSCSMIAREIGVTRNAVIGKMNRMGLSRPKEVITRQKRRKHAAPSNRAKSLGTWRRPRSFLAPVAQPIPVSCEPQPCKEILIRNGPGCTLFELGQEKCRWPISTPGAADFCFCGHVTVKGLPYCPGHARLAYRSA